MGDGIALDHLAIVACRPSLEIACSQWQHIGLLGYQGRPLVVSDSEQPVAAP